MRYDEEIFQQKEEIRELREHCPITCNSITGTGQGSVCRCCEAVQYNQCSWFTGSVQCPVTPPPEPTPIKQCCSMRVMIRNLRRYLANGGTGNQKVCC